MRAVDIFEKNIERANNLFELHRVLFKKGRPPKFADDILRAAIVFAAAALDAYMHDKVSEVTPRVIRTKKDKLPGNLVEIFKSNGISYELLIGLLFSRQHEKVFRRAVKKHYEERTIQDVGDIDKIAKILGISDFWFKLSSSLNKRPGNTKKTNKAGIKDYIQPYISRRHGIVHEADLWEGRMRMRPITVPYAKGAIKRINLFVVKLNNVIDNEYPA